MSVEGLLLCASEPSQPSRLPPSFFWLLHCAKCSSALPLSAQESPRPGQGTQATRGFQWESADPRASYNLFVPILTFRTQDSPPGHCPSFYQLHRYCTCPICAGERAVSLTSPWPASWASPRERSLWPTPRPGCCHLSHPTHCPPQKGCGCRGHHPNNALLPSTVTPNKSRDKEAENRVISAAPWLFWGGSGVSGVTGVKTPAAQLPKAPDNPPACPPLHTWATPPPSLD